MARSLRVEYEGAIYHVTVRGNDRRNIFLVCKSGDTILFSRLLWSAGSSGQEFAAEQGLEFLHERLAA